MSDDIVREVRELVDAACKGTNPPIHRYSKFDRTLVVPLLEEAERLRYEVEQLRLEVENLKRGDSNGV
jgi:ABC-type transporter Mla MlaB component